MLYNKGKNAASKHVAIYCRKNGMSGNRLGITISTKLGGAVIRNRIRRRYKEIYRLNEANLLAGYDIVLVARMQSRLAQYRELESSILALFGKLGIMTSGSNKRNMGGNATGVIT